MAKSWSSRSIIRSFHQIASKPSTSGNATSSGISHFITNNPKVIENPTFSSWLLNSQKSYFASSANLPGVLGKLHPHAIFLPRRNFLGFRYFSLMNHEMGSMNFAQKMVKNPGLVLKNAIARYKEAVRLQIEAFWKRNYLVVLGAGGFVACILLWRVLFGIANAFIGFSEGMAKYGFLALSSAIVAFTNYYACYHWLNANVHVEMIKRFCGSYHSYHYNCMLDRFTSINKDTWSAGLYFRSRFTINPDKVYRMAMRRLNTSAGILEVMGAPLTGTDLRAYVMSGGGISLKNFRPTLRSKRCFLIFPIQGSERKGLVSVEVKKKKGQYDMKLLAVDVPIPTGPDQRLFLVGDEEEYRIGGGLISELRDPVVKAMAAAKEFEARDQKEDEEDAARELEEAERKRREEIEKLEKADSQ